MQKSRIFALFFVKIDQIILINAHKQEKKPYLKEKAVFSERTASMNESSCSLRVFHAAADTEELLVSINNETGSVSYRGLTGRFPVLPGFVTVTLAGARSKRIYLKKTLSLFCSVPYTAAIIQTGHGPDLLLLCDASCPEFPEDSGVLRAVSLAFGAPPLDLYLFGNRLLFPSVSFKEATCFKPIPAGEYGLYLTPEQDMDSPLLSVLISLEAGSQQTLCILNGSWQPEALDVMILPN